VQIDHPLRAFCTVLSFDRVLPRVLYWLAVLVVALALLVAVVLLLAGRDSASIGAVSFANTTIR
jgi:hypothetical protein